MAGSPGCSASRTGTIPAALGPEGVPIDWHVVRVLFRVQVDTPTEPVVTEAAGGSTDGGRMVHARRRRLSCG